MKTFLKTIISLVMFSFFALFAEANGTFETNIPHSISGGSATLFGVLSGDHSDTKKVWFEYGRSKSSLSKTSGAKKAEGVLVNIEIDDLSPDTSYYYRTVLQRDSGALSLGDIVSFKTGSNFISNSYDNGPDFVSEEGSSSDQNPSSLNQNTSSGDVLSDYNFIGSFFENRNKKKEEKELQEQQEEYEKELEKERKENEKLAQLLDQERARQAQISGYKNSSFRSLGAASVSQAGVEGVNYSSLLLVAIMMFVVIGLLYLIMRKKRRVAYRPIYRSGAAAQNPNSYNQNRVPHHYDERYHR